MFDKLLKLFKKDKSSDKGGGVEIKMSFFGAAQNVTGSRHLMQANGVNVLVDCGLYQERQFRDRNWDPFPVAPSKMMIHHVSKKSPRPTRSPHVNEKALRLSFIGHSLGFESSVRRRRAVKKTKRAGGDRITHESCDTRP